MKTLHMITFCLALTFTTFAFSQIANPEEMSLVVVVNKDNPIEKLTRSELIDLFMGKYVAFPDNSSAMPVELKGDSQIKANFYLELVGMSLARVNAYWSRLRFTGRKRAAVFKANETELISFIKANQQAIGYLPLAQVTDELKVVYIVNE